MAWPEPVRYVSRLFYIALEVSVQCSYLFFLLVLLHFLQYLADITGCSKVDVAEPVLLRLVLHFEIVLDVVELG